MGKLNEIFFGTFVSKRFFFANDTKMSALMFLCVTFRAIFHIRHLISYHMIHKPKTFDDISNKGPQFKITPSLWGNKQVLSTGKAHFLTSIVG